MENWSIAWRPRSLLLNATIVAVCLFTFMITYFTITEPGKSFLQIIHHSKPWSITTTLLIYIHTYSIYGFLIINSDHSQYTKLQFRIAIAATICYVVATFALTYLNDGDLHAPLLGHIIVIFVGIASLACSHGLIQYTYLLVMLLTYLLGYFHVAWQYITVLMVLIDREFKVLTMPAEHREKLSNSLIISTYSYRRVHTVQL